MIFKKRISKKFRQIKFSSYHVLDSLYAPLDQEFIRRTRNIRLIPKERNRVGGKYSYAEWAHVVGIFQTLIYIHLTKKQNNKILDVGCGTGLVAIASEPFLRENGTYVGIDITKKHIDFCQKHYPSSIFKFIHLDANNLAYTSSPKRKVVNWPINDNSFDLVTALSVWTHFAEEDALFYFKEVNRTLKPNGKAIITFFVLDKVYDRSLSIRSNEIGRYHNTTQDLWVFDQQAYGSDAWFHPQWVSVPEAAIGITNAGIERLISHTQLKLETHYKGNWKEEPGVFFQDVLVFQKS